MADRIKTPLGALIKDPRSATPHERLQAAVAAVMGAADQHHLATLGLDWWHWAGHPVQAYAEARLQGLRILLSLALCDGKEQQLVDLVRAELASLLQVLDQQAESLARPDDSQRLYSSDCLCCQERVLDELRARGGADRVEDAHSRLDAIGLVRLLSQNVFAVHEGSRRDEVVGGTPILS